jgi:peroxiredoxin Q/BCP
VEKQAAFKKKYNLPFTLLADKDHKIAEAYGAWQEKSMMGKKYMGIVRSTVIIDPQGKVARVFEKVKDAATHPRVTLRGDRRGQRSGPAGGN